MHSSPQRALQSFPTLPLQSLQPSIEISSLLMRSYPPQLPTAPCSPADTWSLTGPPCLLQSLLTPLLNPPPIVKPSPTQSFRTLHYILCIPMLLLCEHKVFLVLFFYWKSFGRFTMPLPIIIKVEYQWPRWLPSNWPRRRRIGQTPHGCPILCTPYERACCSHSTTPPDTV